MTPKTLRLFLSILINIIFFFMIHIQRLHTLIWDALRDLVSFVQFKKREKHPWRSDSFRAYNFAKSITPSWIFFTFYEFKNGTKSRKASHNNLQSAITCSKLTIETLEQGVKYVQS